MISPQIRSDQIRSHTNVYLQAACALPWPATEEDFDWEGDRPLNIPMEQLVVYEMHVRGFTQDKGSGVHAPGVYVRARVCVRACVCVGGGSACIL